jgi:hypothetical protein
LYIAGNKIAIFHAFIQKEKTNYSRSLLIAPDEFPIDRSMKAIYLRDVKSIYYSMGEEPPYSDEDLIGKYFFTHLSDTLDTTDYYTSGFDVVEDDEENYDRTTMIKYSEAILNNKECVVGDHLILGSYFYVTDEIEDTYGISTKVPIHLISTYYDTQFIDILEASGFIDSLIASHPTAKYLNFIGSKKIDNITARKAKNFDILYMPSCNREVIGWKFATIYSGCRDYFVNTIYNYYYRDIYDYYDNFIGLAIVQMTVTQVITRSMETALDRDFYDEIMVRYLFEMYGIPYYSDLPYQTQRRLVKSLNLLIRNKATNTVVYDIASILGYHDIKVYKYYLVKERLFDSDEALYNEDEISKEIVLNSAGELAEEMTVINNLEKMYDVYFQKVDLKETNFQNALVDAENRVDYDSIVMNDPLWWDDDETFEEVYGDSTKYTADNEGSVYHRQYNYMETKYLGISISYKMSEVIYENILLLRAIFDKKDEVADITVTLPKITGTADVSLFDLIAFLCAAISKQYNLSGEILTKYSSILDVMGYITEDVDGYRPCDTLVFNFEKLTNAETYKELMKNPSRYIKPDELETFKSYLNSLTINQATVSEKVDALNDMYSDIKGLGYYIGRKMSEAENLMEYRAWRDFYEALFIGQENNEMFTLGNTGTVATTYLEYLKVMNPSLYNAIDEADDVHLYTMIDHAISRLEKVIHDLKTLYTVNDSNSSLLDYLIKLVKFFKSYTTDLIDVTTQYVFDMRPDNLFKLVEYYKMFEVDINKDVYKLMYADTAKVIETYKETDPLKYKEIIHHIHETEFITDGASINHLNCKTCKNFNACRKYCRNDKNTCEGFYRDEGKDIACRFYGYDSSGFYKYISSYRDLLLSADYKDFSDIHCMIRSHLSYVYYAYKLVTGYNPYYDEDQTFDTTTLIDLVYDSLNRLNDVIGKHEGFPFITDVGCQGIEKWITLLTKKDSEIPRICTNKNYPCREKICNIRYTKDEARLLDIVLESDKPFKYVEEIGLYAKAWLGSYHLFSKDEINKCIEHEIMDEPTLLKFAEEIGMDVTAIGKDNVRCLFDTFSEVFQTDIVLDHMGFREELIFLEKDPE